MFKLPETAQEVFDIVYKHLLTQMRKSDDGLTCLYRGDDGLKCAAGCLIPDEAYSGQMEEQDWNMLVNAGMVPNNHKSLISDLQFVHDSHDPEEWKDLLVETANDYGLTCPSL